MRGTEFAEMAAFVAIAENRSFAKAAAQLGISRPTLSQTLRGLEERLGVRLLNRTTRSVAPTEPGERLLNRLKPALGEVSAAIEEMHTFRDKPAGLLRITAAPPAADLFVAPMVTAFLRKYPEVTLELSVDRALTDIVSERFDAGIRYGERVDRDMIAIRVSKDVRFVVVGSPGYLRRHGVPATPRDLRAHNCIRARLPSGAVFGWDFTKNGQKIEAAVEGSLVVNDIDFMIRGALEGIGLAYLLDTQVATYVARRRLIPVLQEWSPARSGFYLYYSSRRHVPPALRAFSEFLKVSLRRQAD
jgi:DNA-binding transcriptional LysR family regulator